MKAGGTKDLANHEIVTLAVYLLGGDSRYVETEDIAVKANELAPGRFTWKKYQDQINIDTVRKRLWDAKNIEKGSFLVGSERKGWLLTQAGSSFARENASAIGSMNLAKDRLTLGDKQRRRTERTRLLSTPAFKAFRSGGIEAVRKQDAEAFFRLDNYVLGSLRERKLLRLINMFQNDPELASVVNQLAEKVRMSEEHDDQ